MRRLPFSSDYMEGAHPAVLDALIRTNMESTDGYGADPYCAAAEQAILEACGCPEGAVRFLVGGTQTNALIISCLLRPYQGVIAAESGHIAVHEAGAIEAGGHKVLTLPAQNGKITAEAVRALTEAYYDNEVRDHMVQPGMVYLSQPTEYGTLYTHAELAAIRDVCHEYGMLLYVDGARLAYALGSAANDVSLKDLAALTDIFYIGGTKCGLLFGEAVVMPRKDLIPGFFTMIKQHGALLAKGRILGVQFGAMFGVEGVAPESGRLLYEEIGKAVVDHGQRIRAKLIERSLPLYIDSPTNQIFCVYPDAELAALGEKVNYGYMERYDADHTVIRFCTSWATRSEDVDALLEIL